MCGRTACTLAPDDIRQCCTYTNLQGSRVQPRWKDPPGGKKYYPSYNMAPSAHCPVIISGRHCIKNDKTSVENAEAAEYTEEERVIQPMQWGLVPHWHKGSDTSSFAYKMNNARSDGLLSKVTFKRPLETGQRCVVLADGYFEWNTSAGGKKQPYFIYFPPAANDSKVKQEVKDSEAESVDKNVLNKVDVNVKEDESNSDGKRLVTMAGLFDVWKSETGEMLYSYSIITVDAHPCLSFIHDRMPAILNNDDEINAWLDNKTSLNEIMKLIRPVDTLVCHPVSTAVNDSRYKASDTVTRIDLESQSKKDVKSAESSFMKGWLKSGSQSQKRNSMNDHKDDDNDDVKKPKIE